MVDLARLGIIVDTTGVKAGTSELDRLTTAGRRAEGSAQGISSAFFSLRNVFYTLGIGVVAKQFLDIADAAKKIESQLKLATREYGSFYQAQEDVRRISAATRNELEATSVLYGNFVRNSQAMGKSQDEAARATETFAKALKISGAGASEAAASTRQFGQALASGVLRGDEFNSVMENAPRLAKLLADSLNTNVGALRKMAEEGELTSDKLYAALTDRKFTAGIDAEFKEVPVTFSEAMQQVKDAATITFGAFDKGGQFSTMLSEFITDGAGGFADLEDAALEFGVETRAILEGLYDAFEPFVNSGIEAFKELFDFLGIKVADSRTQIAELLGSLDSLLNIGPSIANVFGANGKYDSNLRGRFEQSAKDSERASKGRLGEEWISNASRGFDAMGNSTRSSSVPTSGGDGKEGKKSEAEKAYEKAVKSSENFIKQLEIERAELGKTDTQVKLMAAQRAAALAPTEALRNSIMANARALADETLAFTAQEGANEALIKIAEENRKQNEDNVKSLEQLVSAMEFENEILGMSVEERTVAIAMRELEARGIEATSIEVQALIEKYRQLAKEKGDATALEEYDFLTKRGEDDGKNMARGIADNIVGNRKETEVEARRKAYAEIDRMRKLDVLSETEAARAKRRIDQEYLNAKLSMTADILGQLSTLQSSKSKELRAIGKAAAIAEATMNTYLAINKALASLPPPWNIAAAAAIGVAGFANVASIAGLKDGGRVVGPGGPRDDMVPLWGSNGEFMVNAQATAENLPWLEAINSGRKLPAFADGGMIATVPMPVQIPANNNSRSGGVKVELHNYGTSKLFDVEQLSRDEIRIIARDEASTVVSKETPKVVAAQVRDPNSRISKAMGDGFNVARRR